MSEDVTLFNTATFYGPLNKDGFGANLRLINKCLKAGVDRSKIQIMCKIGMDTKAELSETGKRWVMSGSMDALRADVDYALAELGVDYIDIIVLCRVPTDVTIEEAVKNMKILVDEGKARHIGLSEASAETITRALTVAPIYCIEQEWSMWTRDIEADIVPCCRANNIKIVAYSPLGRGFLTGSIRSRSDVEHPYDFRFSMQPRFAEGTFQKNLELLDKVEAIAKKNSCTVGQLALAWLTAKGPDVIPIPGTSSMAHLEENLAARQITLSPDDVAAIDSIYPPDATGEIYGQRYAGLHNTFHKNGGH